MSTGTGLRATPDTAAFRATVREWLAEHRGMAPRVRAQPTSGDVAQWRAWSSAIAEAGFAGITWPEDASGRGLSYAHLEVWQSECARAGLPDHFGVIGTDMAGPTIVEWGTPEQRERLLPPILSAAEVWCQGFSEPDSGSDLAAARTRAVLDGDEWVIDGQKVWSSFAQWSHWCLLVARTEPDAPKHKGLSMLLVDMTLPGIEVRPLPQITGDPEFNEIFFAGVRIPRDSMLGGRGDGWKVALTTLDHERATHGIALSAHLLSELEAVRRLLRDPRTDGGRAAADADLRDRFAELWTSCQALRVTNLRSIAQLDRTGKPGPEGTIAKLHWSETNQRLAALARDAMGLHALLSGTAAPDHGHWAYNLLRTRGNTIEAGTSEILRNIIAERVLGLPRAR
ncbi:acyl-CoA dehydrogenase family protein [Pseudonocardia alni]|uniref:acyl-CoA dehydrogenase family protein n=1 Tax=Pseudonocardia alni TaxID=33907 RepID=UPI0033187F37